MSDGHQRYFSTNGGPPMGGFPMVPPPAASKKEEEAKTRTHYVVPQHPSNRGNPQPPNGGVPPGVMWPPPAPVSWIYSTPSPPVMPPPPPPPMMQAFMPGMTAMPAMPSFRFPSGKKSKDKKDKDDDGSDSDDKPKVQTRYVVPQHPKNRKNPQPPNGGLPPGASIVAPMPSWMGGWPSCLPGLPGLSPFNPFAWLHRKPDDDEDGADSNEDESGDKKKDKDGAKAPATPLFFFCPPNAPTAGFGTPGAVGIGAAGTPPSAPLAQPELLLSWADANRFNSKKSNSKQAKENTDEKTKKNTKPKKSIKFMRLPAGLHPERPWPSHQGSWFGMDYTTFTYTEVNEGKSFGLDAGVADVLAAMGGSAWITGATVCVETKPWRWRVVGRLPPFCAWSLREVGIEGKGKGEDGIYFLAEGM